jgi:hypothetical protein
LTPVSLRTAITDTSWLVEPIQFSASGSKRTPCPPSSGSMDMPRAISAIVVPSLGARLATLFAAVSVPAPGMLRTITVGLPGMKRARWRATKRALVS